MSMNNSAGVYDRIVDRSFVVSLRGLLAGGVVISAKKGPVGVNIVTSAREFVDTYGLPSRDNPSMYAALRYLNRANILTVRRVVNDAIAAEGELLVDVDPPNEDFEPHLSIVAANPGAWGNDVTVTFANIVGAPSGVFALIVNIDGEEVERWEVSRDPEAKNGFGSNVYIEEVVNQNSAYIRVTDNVTISDAYDMSATISLADGSDDTVAPTAGQINIGWDDFLDPSAVPAQLLINAGWAVPAVQVKMLAVAQARKDAVAILDVPQLMSDNVSQMISYRTDDLAANTYFGGLYGGWLRIYDQYNDREVAIPPSGDIAAIFNYTVDVAERWDAPAGLQRGIIPNALGTTRIFTEGERDLLYINGINPVTAYGGASAVVWGQKTLQVQASALDRFNVVNSVLFINLKLTEALQPFVFEPNTQFVRDQIKFLIESFLENIEQRGGLYGFSVVCDETINTPFVIDNNQLLVDVYVKPTRTAEFIRVSTIITPTGVQLN